jgi:hypothetical protein
MKSIKSVHFMTSFIKLSRSRAMEFEGSEQREIGEISTNELKTM